MDGGYVAKKTKPFFYVSALLKNKKKWRRWGTSKVRTFRFVCHGLASLGLTSRKTKHGQLHGQLHEPLQGPFRGPLHNAFHVPSMHTQIKKTLQIFALFDILFSRLEQEKNTTPPSENTPLNDPHRTLGSCVSV